MRDTQELKEIERQDEVYGLHCSVSLRGSTEDARLPLPTLILLAAHASTRITISRNNRTAC